VAPRPAGLLRHGLGGGAGRPEVASLGIALAAVVLLPRIEFPAERAARQGDRVVPAGREGKPADRRAAVRAWESFSPARGSRPRDPHAPGPGEPRGSRARAAPRRILRAVAGLLQGGSPRARREGPREDGRVRSFRGSASPPPRHLHPGEGLGEGGRRRQEARGERQAQLPEGNRQLLLRARQHRARARPSRGRAEILEQGARRQPQVRTRQPAARRMARARRQARRSTRGRRSRRRIRRISGWSPKA
jgi:hypothetical protein